MAMLLPNSCFIHIPKCGGSWVRAMIERLGLNEGETGDDSIRPFQFRAHMTPTEARKWTDKPFFTFLRDRPEWYRSCYMHRKDTGQWPVLNESDKAMQYKGQAFGDWVADLLERRPKYCSNLYDAYTVGVKHIGFAKILEQETAVLLHILEGVSSLPELDYQNVGKGERPEITNEIHDLILERG